MKKAVIAATGVLILIIACSKKADMVVTDCTISKSFSIDVNPIIQSTCAVNSGCHASGSTNGPGPLTTYAQIFNARSSIRIAIANGTMPQNSTLSVSQKNSILCWIDSGATNN